MNAKEARELYEQAAEAEKQNNKERELERQQNAENARKFAKSDVEVEYTKVQSLIQEAAKNKYTRLLYSKEYINEQCGFAYLETLGIELCIRLKEDGYEFTPNKISYHDEPNSKQFGSTYICHKLTFEIRW